MTGVVARTGWRGIPELSEVTGRWSTGQAINVVKLPLPCPHRRCQRVSCNMKEVHLPLGGEGAALVQVP